MPCLLTYEIRKKISVFYLKIGIFLLTSDLVNLSFSFFRFHFSALNYLTFSYKIFAQNWILVHFLKYLYKFSNKITLSRQKNTKSKKKKTKTQYELF